MKLFTIKGVEVGVESVSIDTEEKLLSPAFTGSYRDRILTVSVAMWHFKIGIYVSWSGATHLGDA